MSKTRNISVLILALCLLLTLLTGCMRIELDINIKNNGKADVSMLYAMADSTLDAGEAALDPEEIEEYESQGWTVEDYSQDGYTGFILKQNDLDLSESEIMEGSSGSIRKEGSTYIVDLSLISEEEQADFGESASWLKSMGGSFIVRLHLPVKPEKHNATSVSDDGKTLEWDLLSMDVTEPIHVEFKTGSNAVMIGIVAAVIVAAIIAFALLKKSGKEEPVPAIPENVQPEDAFRADEPPVPPFPEEVKPEQFIPEEAKPESFIPEEVKPEEEPGEEGSL